MQVETTSSTTAPKRKAVDDAFERLFGYKWGTTFALKDNDIQSSSSIQQLLAIFGPTRAARIVGSRGTKRQKIAVDATTSSAADDLIKNYKSIPLPKTLQAATVTETKIFAGQQVTTTTKAASSSKKPSAKKANPAAGAGGVDAVLAQIAGPGKLSTAQKTSDDWESFKGSDKQLQDELEKTAQSKDAFLVKQDFLNRVDQRTFELERDERERERAKRTTTK